MTPLSRHTHGWLLVAQLAILLPLLPHFTPWSLLVISLCLVWRMGIFFGRVARPPKLLVNLMGLTALVIMVLALGQEDMLTILINLLVLAYGLKAIEIRHRGDLAAVVLTGFFLIGLQMLHFHTTFWIAFQWATLGINAAVLVSAFRPGSRLGSAGLAFQLLLFSLPLAALLFLVMPRSGGLWSMALSPAARTGLSDTMALGDISRLGRSADPVMTATFNDGVPPPEQRYWRALVLGDYDGERWHGASEQILLQQIVRAPIEHYQLQVEPGQTPWLPALEFSDSTHPDVLPLDLDRLVWQRPPFTRTVVPMVRVTPPSSSRQLPVDVERWLRLPQGSNPDSWQFARSLLKELSPGFAASAESPRQADSQAFADAVLSHFRQSDYRYTLAPPPLQVNQIDSFLFNNKAGFCGHYASSLVFLARAAGIPARIVTGYQGGEPTEDGKSLKLYQYHAHAWAELWQPGDGWFRVDPTAAVSPDRIELGATSALATEPDFLADAPLARWARTLGMSDNPLSGLLAQWQQQLVNYDKIRQASVGQWLQQHWPSVVAITVLFILVLFAGRQLRRHLRRSLGLIGLYQQMETTLASHGMEPLAGESPDAFARRIGSRYPSLAQPLDEFIAAFQLLRYAPKAASNEQNTAVNDPSAKLQSAWRALQQALRQGAKLGLWPSNSGKPPLYPKQRNLQTSRPGP